MGGTRHPGLAPVMLAAALAASPARALDLSAQVQPGYTNATTTTREETGQEHHSDSELWQQRYRLGLDGAIMPLLTLNAGGVLDWRLGTNSADGLETHLDDKRWVGFARLRLGSGILGGGLDYDRRDETSASTTAGVRSGSRIVSDTYGASLSWKPADLPSLDLQLHRVDGYDWARALIDRTTDEALIATRFKPLHELDLGLSFRAAQTDDRLAELRTRDLTQAIVATYTDSYLGGRASAYVSYNAAGRVSTTSVGGGAGATVPTVQIPAGGLSIVEVFPTIPTQVTLNPNAALIDGNLTTSAGLNLGFSASVGGLRQYRDIGAQFPNVITPVNEVYVWVDRQLSAEVAAGFTWEAYRSDDNVTWTPIAITGAVQFGLLQNRFEIPVERTEARYLKVVTRPLPATLTTDPQYAEILVTEAQFLLLVPVEQVRGRTSSFAGSLNATGRLSLVPSVGLTYDVSSFITHSDQRRVTWAITNGLSASRQLRRTIRLSGRVERTDTDSGLGHESTNRWGGALFVEPLPTLSGAVTYSGLFSQTKAGNALTQSLGLLGRADLYEGISLSANATQGVGYNEAHQTVLSTTGAAGLTLVPNRYLTASGGTSFTIGSQRGVDTPTRTDRRVALDAAASLTPFPALALSGGVSRFLQKGVPAQTLANFTASLSPFPGGALSLRYTYQETLDTASDLRTRTHGPSLRWNVRPGWFFDSSYSFQETSAPAERTTGRVFNATLIGTLR